jgi:hypothetical protein
MRRGWSNVAGPAGHKGVIGCLTGGFELLGRNLLLLALPLVLDLVLWLGPRVSIAPILLRVTQALETQPAADAQMASQIGQAADLLEQFAGQFNLLSALGAIPLLQVPSLLARRGGGGGSPLGEPRVFSLSSPFAMIPWWAGLLLAGIVFGFLYLNEIAHHVETLPGYSENPVGTAGVTDTVPASYSAQDSVRKLARFLLFALGLAIAAFSVLSLWLIVVAMGTLIAQSLGILLWIAGVGLVSYAALHLVFVVPGLLLGNRRLLQAVGESILLSHMHLSSVVGLVVVAAVIYEGLAFAWSLPSTNSWALLVGIAGNAAVATGLTGAAFLFYRERMMVADPTSEGIE